MRTASFVASLLSLPGLAAAHPGHGVDSTGQTLAHYMTDPLHLFPVVLLAALMFAGGRALFSRRHN